MKLQRRRTVTRWIAVLTLMLLWEQKAFADVTKGESGGFVTGLRHSLSTSRSAISPNSPNFFVDLSQHSK
jgi:hypothetical protein